MRLDADEEMDLKRIIMYSVVLLCVKIQYAI
jgi:hypothetical protein